MHDSRGRKIEFGDFIVTKSWAHDGKQRLMKVVGGTSQSNSCNIQAMDWDLPTPACLTASETTVVLTRDGELLATFPPAETFGAGG